MSRVDQILVEACKRSEASLAIVEPAVRLTHGELLSGAECVSEELGRQGLRPGDVIAITGSRSASVILATIGAWLSGTIVVLVDEALPVARRAEMIRCSGADAIIECSAGGTWSVLPRVQETAEGFPPAQRGEDHAYIAFTSGSTGKPKAIVGSHRGLASFLEWQSSEFEIGPRDRFAHLTNLSFDVWFRDALTPLLSGAQLHLPGEAHFDAEALIEFVRKEALTGLHIVPSVAKMWVAAGQNIPPIKSLRASFFAGEPLDSTLVQDWRRIFPDTEVVNLYGPTETTLAQHYFRVPSKPMQGIQPVGVNLPRSRTYILDGEGNPVPPGATGKVWIDAKYPSHGYLVEGVLTSPMSHITTPDGQAAAYSTGDLGRMNEAGELELRGRADDQVKIGGVRIELQEVRSVIQSHPSVNDAFVCVGDGLLGKVIVAVVDGDPSSQAEVRDHASTRLMGAMMPGSYIFTALVMLPNGKVDRKAMTEMAQKYLRDRDHDRVHGRPEPVGPAGDDVSGRMGALWEAVAGATPADFADGNRTFFDVGGTSLTMVMLHVSLQREFDVKFPVVKLFEYPTFTSQCDFIVKLLTPGGPSAASPRAAAAALGRRRIIESRRGRSRTDQT